MAFSSDSSKSTAPPGFRYDVFLSFRGETRYGFTDHLYTALKQAGFLTFRDDAIERGKQQLSTELEKAIRESAISIIDFSEGFASSDWCLNEVKMIIETNETPNSKHEIVPFFYKVEPSDIRYQNGSFKAAFRAHAKSIKSQKSRKKKKELREKVEAWKKALTEASHLPGIVYKDGYESTFIKQVVSCVIKKVGNKGLYVGDTIVGIKENIEEIESWLQDPAADVVFFIDGMGGIGKSTVAKCVYNLNFRNYEASCFLADINKEHISNPTTGLRRFQSQLLTTILKSEEKITVWDVDDGTRKITDVISCKKVLLILDDVATSQQLETLLGPKRFCPGSKVIVTTRHTNLSADFKVHRPHLHSVTPLPNHDAVTLFSLYAFDQDKPPEPYILQSQLVLGRCMGHPSALIEWGRQLCGLKSDEWEDKWRKMKTVPVINTQKGLEASYELLEYDMDKNLFLHIACFFEGEQKDYIIKLLSECNLHPKDGITVLTDNNLLSVEDGRVMMHPSIKEMGRELVRKEAPKETGKRSRLWHHEDCINVLKEHAGTKNVEGLMIDKQKLDEVKSTLSPNDATMHGKDVVFEICALEKMQNLMLLQLNFLAYSGSSKKLPSKLRLLSWHGFSLKAIPNNISLENLVVLDMSYSKGKRVRKDFKGITSLKILNLSYCVKLNETPALNRLPGLESLILKGCSSLIKVDESITNHMKIPLLDITDCVSLTYLPCLPECLTNVIKTGCSIADIVDDERVVGDVV